MGSKPRHWQPKSNPQRPRFVCNNNRVKGARSTAASSESASASRSLRWRDGSPANSCATEATELQGEWDISRGFNSRPGCDHTIAVQILILGSKATAGPVYQLRRLQVPRRSVRANVVRSYRWQLWNSEEFKYGVSLWFHIHADVCSSFEDQKQPAALRTAFTMPAEICTVQADRIGKTNTHVKEI